MEASGDYAMVGFIFSNPTDSAQPEGYVGTLISASDWNNVYPSEGLAEAIVKGIDYINLSDDEVSITTDLGFPAVLIRDPSLFDFEYTTSYPTRAPTATFQALIESYGLERLMTDLDLSGEEITLLAPSDEAFLELPDDFVQQLVDPSDPDRLGTFLANHTLVGRNEMDFLTPVSEYVTETVVEPSEWSEAVDRAEIIVVRPNLNVSDNIIIQVVNQLIITDSFADLIVID
ncbi:MAG: fasciclin domain-containing protein [Pseudomonadota bacterium]